MQKTNFSTFSGSKAHLFAVTTLPAVLKSLSEGKDVATTPKYLRAMHNKLG